MKWEKGKYYVKLRQETNTERLHQLISVSYFRVNHEYNEAGAHLSVQGVSCCGDDSCRWVDGKQVWSSQETIPDLDVLRSWFISVCSIHLAYHRPCVVKHDHGVYYHPHWRSNTSGLLLSTSRSWPGLLCSSTVNCSASWNVGALSFSSSTFMVMSKGESVSWFVTWL